ncbi:MAG: hypothetical protein ACI8W7_000884 [Gammaproteobacteria bacterium]|jgi:hypothetical protein
MAIDAIFDPQQDEDVLPDGRTDLAVLELDTTDKRCWPCTLPNSLCRC